jgi:transcriptional regulator with GAF, ATPase, and Fis domain
VEFAPEAVEAMSRMFLEDGLRTLKGIIKETSANAPRGTIVTADDVEVVALRRALPRANFAEPWSGFSLKEEMRQPERRFIELALKAAEGKISVAARLLGFNHNEILTSIIKSRYPELLAARKPPIPRRRSIIRKPQKPKR